MSSDPSQAYQDRLKAFSAELAMVRKSSNRYSNARLAVFLATTAIFLVLVFLSQAIPALLAVFLGSLVFTLLVRRHAAATARENLAERLVAINRAGLERQAGRWTAFPTDGKEFADSNHPFTSDLDIFGSASLFQWLNACETRLGKALLSQWLAHPSRQRDWIILNQAMVKELAPKLDWRQRFQAAGRALPKGEDPEGLLRWAEGGEEVLSRREAALRFLPALLAGLALMSAFNPGYLAGAALMLAIQMAIASWNQRKQGDMLAGIARHRENLDGYLELLQRIEGGTFSDSSLKALEEGLRGQGIPASGAVRKLQNMVDWMETRRNPLVHFLLNATLLWDIQWLRVFVAWRRDHGRKLRHWLETIARLEALSSLAMAAFENPDWAYPLVEDDPPLLEAGQAGHPLIASSERVCNDLLIARSGEIHIITGSNMSGKSTLLRTAGINLALAYAGAPVCAGAFRCAPVEVHTSMRLRDDLEKRISSFYAELLRIKAIVAAAREGRRVLFLVDEIFRGTNSKDRHAGASSVLRQLHALGAAGLVSTHDLELAGLESANPAAFHNFHFRESYADGAIRFDFRLRPGVSTTTNAMHLIRMVGLTEERPA